MKTFTFNTCAVIIMSTSFVLTGQNPLFHADITMQEAATSSMFAKNETMDMIAYSKILCLISTEEKISLKAEVHKGTWPLVMFDFS